MNILFLGTGAADWDINQHKDMEGFRRNASALIDNCLLIDPGPNVCDALAAFGKKAEDIRYILNTHTHADHYCEETVTKLKNATVKAVSDGEEKACGKYTVTALRGNHATCPGTQHFIISDGEKRLFYGLDGAWLLYEEVAAIKSAGVDFAVFDATIGDVPGDYRIFEHNNLAMVLEMKRTLQPYIRRFCISHMARTLHGTQKELEAQMMPFDIEVAFDGYETEI